MKKKLTVNEQIDYMKNIMGIQFNIINEDEAKDYLLNNTFFFKLKSFARNFEKYQNPKLEKFGKYVNLDFAYIQELSLLDVTFRKLVLSMILDVEHYLKVQLLNDITNNNKYDGYEIVKELLENIPSIKDKLDTRKKSNSDKSYTYKLAYNNDIQNTPVWVLVEIISFGDLIELCGLYYSKNETTLYNKIRKLLANINYLRNAAAHNSCILNNFACNELTNPTESLRSRVYKMFNPKIVTKNTVYTKLKNRVIHDLLSLLEVYCLIVNDKKIRKKGIANLYRFLKYRCLLHSDYFNSHTKIKDNYEFLIMAVDKYRHC